LRDRDRLLMQVGFEHLESDFKFLLGIPQNRTEAILLDRLRALGGAVHRPLQTTAIVPGLDKIAVTLASGQVVNAHWLIGCDGGHSAVREAAGIGFPGGGYDETFALADVHLDPPVDPTVMVLYLASEGLLLLAPLPEGHVRLIATVDEAPPQPDAAFMQPLVDRLGPAAGTLRIRDVVWSSRFHIQHRVSDTPRKGRILLCGDAAHLHSPAGGQGMNTGIQDAVSLADALHAAAGGDAEAELDAWAARRHEIAEGVVSLTDRMTRIATLKSTPARVLRNAGMVLAGHVPGLTQRIAHQLAELDNR
jgi:2-polyprenyl-6-methoxyphenol hydroxylase-like FAD-dependent oxidoreductase